MKVIQTTYNGYKFRSRLEARWAVFFDAIGIKYEYEPEGYELPSGWYLPDFYIKHPYDSWNGNYVRKMFIEIKPEPFTDQARKLCEELCVATGEDVGLLVGIPEYIIYEMYASHHHPQGKPEAVLLDFVFHKSKYGLYVNTGWSQQDYEHDREYWDDYQKERDLAKAARFEHKRKRK